jgi:hypothetical protein
MPLPPFKSGSFALAAGAALAAPLFLNNDDRGYFGTAVLTTPLIAAGAAIGGDVFRLAQENSAKFIKFSKSAFNKPVNAAVTYEEIQQLRREVQSGNMFMSEFQKHNLSYLNNFTKSTSDSRREIRALRSQLKTLARNKSFTSLLSNAIQAEEYRVMSAAELASTGGQHVFKDLSLREGIAKIRRRSKNADFVRGLNYRLRSISKLKDQGGSTYPVIGDFGPGSGEGLISSSYNFRRMDIRSKFSAAYGDVYEHLDRAMSGGLISGAEFLTLNDPSSKAIQHFTGLRLHRQGEKALDLLLVQKDGGTFMSDARRGVSRKIGSPRWGIMESDIWTLRNLNRDFKDLRDTLNISQFQTYVDPLRDGFDQFGERDGAIYRQDPFSMYARNQQVVLDRLGGFSEDKGYMGLSPRQQEAALVTMNEKYGLVKAWGDSNINKGLLETEELTQLHLGGVINTEKTSRVLRGVAKPIMASEDRGSFSMSDARAPFSRTSKWASVLPGETPPEFGVRIGMVSPHLKSLVSDLPAEINKESLAAYANTAMDYISRDLVDNGIQASRDQIRNMWTALAGRMSNEADGRAIRRLGYLGEGDHLLLRQSGEAGMPYAVSAKTKYVHDLRLNDVKGMIANGTEFGPDTLLGFSNGNAVTAGGRWNRIQDFRQMTDGRLALSVLESSPISSAKLDTIVKGLSVGTTKQEASHIKEFLNLYGGITGTGYGVADDTDILMLQHYAHNKAPLAESMVNIASDTFRRLESSGELGAVQSYVDALEYGGFSYKNGQLINDVSVFAKATEQRRLYLADTVKVIEEMMANVGARVKAGQIQGDAFIHRYLGAGGNLSLTDYIFRRAAPANAMITDSVEQNVVEQAGITFDMLGNLELRGFSGTTKELKNMSRVDGDILATKSVMDYLNTGDFSQPLGAALSVNEAFPNLRLTENGRFVGLSEAGVRAGSVFDPAHELAAGNWSLRLDDGSHVPVLGHDAYGGKINQYGAGEFSTNSREKALARIVEANASGDKNAMAAAKASYVDELRQFGYGKEGFMRARRTYPMGVAGRIQTRPSSVPGNPFEIAIAPNLIERIQNKQIREALLNKRAEDVFAVVARHPVSNMPFTKVVVDSRLNPNTIALDEGMRGLLMADDDGDILNAFFLKPGGDAYKEAAGAYASGQMSEELRIQRAFEGLEDDSRLARNTAAKSLSARAQAVGAGGEALTKELGLVEAEALRRRPAGGSVGRFSNVLTEAMLNLEHNSRITDPTQKAILQRAFWNIRQAPIAAQKKSSSYTLDKALNLASELSYGLHNDAGSGRFYDAMTQMARDFGKDTPFNDDMKILGISRASAREVNGQLVVNPLLEYVKNNRSTFDAFLAGRNTSVQAAARSLTATEDATVKYSGKLLTEFDGLLAYLDPSLRSAVAPSMADHSAEVLGAANESIRNISGGIRNILKDPGIRKTLGIGLGVSAIAGILTTSMGASASFARRRSANEIRPENAVGVEDHIPGEPVAGSMAPSNPPRKVVPGPQGVRTATVAPIQQAVNLEVRTRSGDRSSATERAKTLARMATDGDSNVTVNYRSRPKNTSLRMQERLRDMRGDN